MRRSWHLFLARLAICGLAASAGGGVVLVGCAASADVKFVGAEHPAVSPDDVEILGDQTPPGFLVTGVVTAACEMMNGASGVFEMDCTKAEMIALARRQAAASGGHALVDVTCRAEMLERSFEKVDGGGIKATTRERLTCRATVARWRHGNRVRRPAASGTVALTRAKVGGRRVTINEIPVDVAFAPAAGFKPQGERELRNVGVLEQVPRGYATLGKISATCANACAPRHSRAALRQEAARLGGTAIAAVYCEVAGADRWRCEASLIGGAVSAGVDGPGVDGPRVDVRLSDAGRADGGEGTAIADAAERADAADADGQRAADAGAADANDGAARSDAASEAAL